MARARREMSELISDARRKLNDGTDGSTSYWSDADMLAYLQESFDELEMMLLANHEGYNTTVYDADIVQGQRDYPLPEEVTTVKRVFYVRSGGKVALEEDRQHYGYYLDDDTTGEPLTYRLVDNAVVLYPTPGNNVTGGLSVEADISADRLSLTSKLPDSFPPQSETYLITCTAIKALEAQSVDSDLANSQLEALVRGKVRMERRLEDMAYRRSYGITTNPGFDWGG